MGSAGHPSQRRTGRVAAERLAGVLSGTGRPHWVSAGTGVAPGRRRLDHTLLVCDQAARIAAREELQADDRLILLLAALCHDLGKPAATRVDPAGGRIRSDGHATAGVAPTRRFLARIGCPPSLYAAVECLVAEHMSHIGLPVEPTPVRRLANRLARLSGGAITIARWSALVEADHSGRPPLPPGNPAAPLRILAEQLAVADQAPIPLVTG